MRRSCRAKLRCIFVSNAQGQRLNRLQSTSRWAVILRWAKQFPGYVMRWPVMVGFGAKWIRLRSCWKLCERVGQCPDLTPETQTHPRWNRMRTSSTCSRRFATPTPMKNSSRYCRFITRIKFQCLAQHHLNLYRIAWLDGVGVSLTQNRLNLTLIAKSKKPKLNNDRA